MEDELKDKKRIIHDATHGVRVNHRIKCRGQDPSPGRYRAAREKKQLLREMIDEERVAFSVVGDISKAHRRYKHQPSEHSFMGCQLSTEETVPGDPDSQLVYVNLVGTLARFPLARPPPVCGRPGVTGPNRSRKTGHSAQLSFSGDLGFSLQVAEDPRGLLWNG